MHVYPKTSQEIFDIVAKHLLTQNVKAMDGNGICMYRNDKGLKCAVGCLIPSEHYDPSIEKQTLYFLSHDAYINPKLKAFLKDNYGLLLSLQALHDYAEPKQWAQSLQYMAQEYSLTFNYAP